VPRCQDLPKFHGLTPPPSWPYQATVTLRRWGRSQFPNVGKPSHLDAAVCLRLFHWIFIIHCFYRFRSHKI